uniref:Uncharacterized protein n=1 Tax=Triticum urartu TaxID=4572 RepID=A0A8R7PZJ5_TRIUA
MMTSVINYEVMDVFPSTMYNINCMAFNLYSIKRYMDDCMVCGKYTAMMMKMFPLMMMMMDAFSFS